ncbi:MAG: acetyl-CoA C-acyltransferase [Bacteroidia bacterium]|nr:acetyl-CoA C-acyltransferase [Bacteroidia bacterium]MDW8158002.1 acetyl-CoA C-acyltransferase [Bacteroidia bacterium]
MDAYIVAGYRTAIGKAPRGQFRFTRPDDMAAHVIKHLVDSIPGSKDMVDDLIVGNAIPEAEHGLNMARMIALMALGQRVPGVTINRYCASGLEAIAMACSKIHSGLANCIIAGGVESMSLVPVPGYKVVPNYQVAKEHPDWYFGMGLTAEAVAERFNITREECDEFAYHSHRKALAAIEQKLWASEIVPYTVEEVYLDENQKRQTRTYVVDTDEGPRADTSIEKLAKLKPVFKVDGIVTAGNSSQTSDGAAFVMVMSEKVMKELNVQPIAQLVGYGLSGVEPRIMGIGPVEAIPRALAHAGLKMEDISVLELNEAFAAQSVAVIKQLGINPEIVNPNGGAVALGHPLGCTGAKLSIQVINEVKRKNGKYGMVSACVGGGQGIAGIFEVLN